MKAVRFHEYGGPEVLRLVEIAAPHAGPGQVRIAVRAAGVNPSDAKDRAGDARDATPVPLPAGVGFEAAGAVDEIGPGVVGVSLGDAVFGFGASTMAERAILTHWAPKPAAVPFEVAAALSVAGETAWRCLDRLGGGPGQTLLVSGAAGGIGSAVVQLARLRGLVVLGTASAGKQDYLRQLGAIPTTYGPGLVERVRALAPRVDLALDVAGAGNLPELIALTGDPARVLSAGDLSAPAFGVRFCHGPPTDPPRVLAAMAQLVAEGRLAIHVARTYALDEVAAAQAAIATGHVTGKLVVVLG